MGILEVLTEEAKKQGREQGKKIGERAALLATAKKLLKKGISIPVVNQCTGLTKTQLSRLLKQA